MKVSRNIATPMVIGTFCISAVTGVLMFFHWDIGINKFVHEWFSWLFVIAVVLHVVPNFSCFKRYLAFNKSGFIIALLLIVLVASFFPIFDTRGMGRQHRGDRAGQHPDQERSLLSPEQTQYVRFQPPPQ